MKLALKDHMTRKLITINKDSTVAEAYRLMKNFWIRHLPVLDQEEEFIVGMISERDLLAAPSADTAVSQVMSNPIKTFPIETPVKSVVSAMIDEKLSAFLITKDDEIVGIVTSEDMLVLLKEVLKEDDTTQWSLSEIFINPALQRAAYIVGQTGI